MGTILALKVDRTPIELNEDEILFFSSHQNTIYVHTQEGEFIYPISLSDLLAAYQHKGFDKLDRSNVVNTNMVTGFDPERKVVHFNNRPDLFAVVSIPNEKKAKKIVEAQKKEGPT